MELWQQLGQSLHHTVTLLGAQDVVLQMMAPLVYTYLLLKVLVLRRFSPQYSYLPAKLVVVRMQ